MPTPDRSRVVVDANPQPEQNPWGAWSCLGFFALVIMAVFVVKADWSVFTNLWEFLTGHVGSVANGRTEPISQVVQAVLPIQIMDFATSIVLGLCFLLAKMVPRTQVADPVVVGGVLILLILGEEFFARFLFLGLLTRIFQGPAAFYILLLLGNGIWAGLHLIKFKGRSRNPLLVLPQFLGGILYGYLFVRYGFWVTFWVHVVFDAVLFSLVKKYKVSIVDFLLLIYAAIGFGVTTLLLHINNLGLFSLSPWVTSSARNFSPLPGVNFWGYALLLLAVNFGSEVVASILLLDNTEVSRESIKIPYLLLGPPLNALVIFGSFWILGFVVPDMVTRVVIISVLLVALANAKSGSAFARVVLVDFPVVFLMIGALFVLGFWEAVGLLFVFAAVGVIPNILRLVQQRLSDQGNFSVTAD